MDLEILFLAVVDDLRHRVTVVKQHEYNYEYNLLKAAALLRQLLTDGTLLLHQTNKPYRKKFAFRVNPHSKPKLGSDYWQAGDSLGEAATKKVFGPQARLANPSDLDLQKFLKVPVVNFQNTIFTVLDLIQYYSNVDGGVHREEALSERNQKFGVMREIEDLGIKFNGCPPGLYMISVIGQIVLEAIEPLEKEIRTELDEILANIQKETNLAAQRWNENKLATKLLNKTQKQIAPNKRTTNKKPKAKR